METRVNGKKKDAKLVEAVENNRWVAVAGSRWKRI
jgi:hypothetical protein